MKFEEKVRAVAALLANPYDQSMVEALRQAETSIPTLQASLVSAGLSDLADLLNGFDYEAMTILADHVESQITNDAETDEAPVSMKMNLYESIAATMTTFEGETPTISDAFGPLLMARSFVSILAETPGIIEEGDLPPFEFVVPGGAEYESLCAPTNPPEEEDPDFPVGDTVRVSMTSRIEQLAAIPGAVEPAIARQEAFFADGQAKIDLYAKALQLLDAHSKMPMKVIVGAVGSSELLTILLAPTTE